MKIGHVYATDIDILAKHETVMSIVEMILPVESFQSLSLIHIYVPAAV